MTAIHKNELLFSQTLKEIHDFPNESEYYQQLLRNYLLVQNNNTEKAVLFVHN